MEPYAAKTLLKNLVTEHQLTPDTLTTDRSTTMKNMIRLEKVWFNIFEPGSPSEFNEELPDNHPKILHLFDIWHWIKAGESFLCIMNNSNDFSQS